MEAPAASGLAAVAALLLASATVPPRCATGTGLDATSKGFVAVCARVLASAVFFDAAGDILAATGTGVDARGAAVDAAGPLDANGVALPTAGALDACGTALAATDGAAVGVVAAVGLGDVTAEPSGTRTTLRMRVGFDDDAVAVAGFAAGVGAASVAAASGAAGFDVSGCFCADGFDAGGCFGCAAGFGCVAVALGAAFGCWVGGVGAVDCVAGAADAEAMTTGAAFARTRGWPAVGAACAMTVGGTGLAAAGLRAVAAVALTPSPPGATVPAPSGATAGLLPSPLRAWGSSLAPFPRRSTSSRDERDLLLRRTGERVDDRRVARCGDRLRGDLLERSRRGGDLLERDRRGGDLPECGWRGGEYARLGPGPLPSRRPSHSAPRGRSGPGGGGPRRS